jgi:hypothetical protein
MHIGRREKLNHENFWSQILNGRHHLGSLGIAENFILMYVLKKCGMNLSRSGKGTVTGSC